MSVYNLQKKLYNFIKCIKCRKEILKYMRFEEAPQEAYEIMRTCLDENFPELAGCNIKIVFDLKKRTSGGKIVLGSLQKPNELLRFFTIDEAGNDEGYDYLMRIDKKAWTEVMTNDDKKRLIRHELRHSDVDMDASNPYKLRGHSIEDFYSEVRINEDDPRWGERVGQATNSAYEIERG